MDRRTLVIIPATRAQSRHLPHRLFNQRNFGFNEVVDRWTNIIQRLGTQGRPAFMLGEKASTVRLW